MSSHKVPLDTEIDRFKKHLSIPNNIRILFSAPFGAGKSSFLETFFTDNKEYLTIKIFPTSYSVASNKDIFELIKFDILISIFEDYSEFLELDKEDFNSFLLGQMYVLHKMDFYSLSQSVINAFVPKAKPGAELIGDIKTLFEKFNDYKEEINTTDEDAIINYLVSLRMQTGSIKEQDFFTKKIKDYLIQIRENSKKEIVLIIDDLDRLDADHVFRIFNIFTAHYDSKHDQNKFDFDKLILVCDINSIEHLFFHRYGSKAEFNGYIDKFYSHYIFHFNNKKYLIENISKLISTKNHISKNYSNDLTWDLASSYLFEKSDFYSCFRYLLSELVEKEYIKIRNFERFQEYSLPNVTLSDVNKTSFYSDYYHFIVLIYLLNQFFPRPIDTETTLLALSEIYPSDYESSNKTFYYENESIEQLLIQYSLPFLNFSERPSGSVNEYRSSFKTEFGKNIVVIYTDSTSLVDKGFKYLRCLTNVSEITHDKTFVGPKVNRPNPYWFLYKAYLECKNRKYNMGLNEF